MIGERLDEDDLLLVGREAESFDVDVTLGELSAVRSVGVHAPELTLGEECDALSTVNPCSVSFAGSRSGERTLELSVSADGVEHLVALVLLHAVIAHLVSYCLAVGRSSCSSDASHSPECLRRHAVALADGSHVRGLTDHGLCFGIDAGATDCGGDSDG